MNDEGQVDNTQINEFVLKMKKIAQMHKTGRLYCKTRDIWKKGMHHSNLVYYSDELKEQILNNKKINVTYYDDIYYAFIETYIDITGYKLKPMFQLNKSWLIILDRKLLCEDEKRTAFIKLFIKCILNSTSRSISNIDDLTKLKEFKILEQ